MLPWVVNMSPRKPTLEKRILDLKRLDEDSTSLPNKL